MNQRVRHTTRACSTTSSVPNIPIGRVEQAQIIIDFLDDLRSELWDLHGGAIERQRHDDACQDDATDTQQRLNLDDPPF